MKDEPAPSPQILKSFAEDFITTRTKLPSQKTACDHFINFTSYWERTTVRKLDKTVKDDVLNVCLPTTVRAELIPFSIVYPGKFDKEI